MNTWKLNHWLVAALTALLSLPVAAQEDELRELPGYVDFGGLESVYGEPKVMINIGELLLKLAVKVTENEDPEAAEVLEGLKGVRINIYSTQGQTAPALDQVERVKGLLRSDHWEPIVQIKEQGEEVQIFMKADAEGMQGLTVMAVDDEEAVFLNILGAIDPAQVGKVADRFGVNVEVD